MLLFAAMLAGQSAPAAVWTPLPADENAAYAVRQDTLKRDGPRVSFTLRITPTVAEGTGFATGQMDHVLDCEAQTMINLAARTYDAQGQELQRREASPAQQRAEPLFADQGYGEIYAALCPKGAPLPQRGPPPTAVQRP